MAVCLPSLSDLRAERTLAEINQELSLQLEKYKQDFRDLTEKFLVSQATAYSLANHLQKYKCEACKDIVESVLGEKLPGEARRPAEKLAEKPTLQERLRTCDILIQSQARELAQLRQTLQDGKDDSALLKQHLKDLLTHSDLEKQQRQGFRESLSEGYRLAERLACKLSPEIDEDEDDEQAQETPTPSMQLQEVEKKEVHEESKDECVLMPSILQGSSDKHQPYSDDKFNFNQLEADVDPDGPCGYSHAKEDEIPTNISEKQNDHDDLKGPEVVAPRYSRQMPQIVEDGVPQNSLDDYYLTYSVLASLSESFWPYRSSVIFSLEDVDVSYAWDVTKNLADLEDEENQDIICSSMEQLVVEENEVQLASLDDCYLAASIDHHLEGSCPASRSVSFPTEKREVFFSLDVNGDTWEDCHQEPVRFPGSEVPASQAQLQKSTHVTDCLHWQLDQHLDCGDSKAILGLSSTNWAFPTNPDSAIQGPLFLGDTWEDCHQEPVRFSGSEVPASQAQLQKSTHVTDCLHWQLDQHLDCGDSKAILGLSSTNWAFPTNPDSAIQGPLFLGDTWEDCHQEPVRFSGSEVPASQAQLQKSTHVTDCLHWQLDQHLDCGDSKAILGLSSTNWAFPTNPDSAIQGPLFLGDTWEDCHQEPVRFSGSEVPASQAQLQKSTHVTDCLHWQLDQHLDCGDSKAILGLSSTNWAFPTNPDSAIQGPLFLGDTWEDCHQEPVRFSGSEVPASQAQLQKSTHVTDCLHWQLDQHLDCGDSKAILGLSSTNWAFPTNPDSAIQGPLFLGDTWEDCHQEPVRFSGSEVPASQAQLQKSTHVTDCLHWQLDQHLDCGDSKAILGLSSTNWAFPTNPDSAIQGPLFLGDTWEDCHQEPVRFSGSEVPASQAQLQKSTHVTDCLHWQLDQHLDCGDSKAILGLSSTNWAFPTNPDSAIQGPLFLEPDASIRMKNPPKLEGEGSTESTQEHPVSKKIKGLSVLKQKILRSKLLFGKWH